LFDGTIYANTRHSSVHSQRRAYARAYTLLSQLHTPRTTCASQLNPKHFSGMSNMRHTFSGSGVTEGMSGNDSYG